MYALSKTPEQGLLQLRTVLGVFANLRPVRVNPNLADASPLKPAILDGVDMIVVRELTGGIYFGEKQRTAEAASDLCTYTVPEVERIVRVAARLAPFMHTLSRLASPIVRFLSLSTDQIQQRGICCQPVPGLAAASCVRSTRPTSSRRPVSGGT